MDNGKDRESASSGETSHASIVGNPTGPLAGYRILEFGANFTGPMAGMLLGDQGAEVIKVEPPTGDQMRYQASARGGVSAIFISVNRNKRSIVLDLRKPAAIEVFRQLVKSCDVVVQNFRPGVVERLGLGYEDLRKLREDLIFVSISGFGNEGPYSQQRVYDTVIQGVAGVAGAQRDPDTLIPCVVRSAIADKVTALTVSQAITAALLARERTGKGQHLSVNMLGAMLSFWWPDVMSNETFIGAGATAAGAVGDGRPIYKTRDGYVIAVCVSDAEWKGLVEALGKPELVTDPRFGAPARPRRSYQGTARGTQGCLPYSYYRGVAERSASIGCGLRASQLSGQPL